jgi:hypothetical protein
VTLSISCNHLIINRLGFESHKAICFQRVFNLFYVSHLHMSFSSRNFYLTPHIFTANDFPIAEGL